MRSPWKPVGTVKYSTNTLDFTADFMTKICVNWLTDRWESIIEDSILKNAQGEKLFWDWLQSLQSTNALIVGTYVKLDKATMCTDMKANINELLKINANQKTHTELDKQ